MRVCGYRTRKNIYKIYANFRLRNSRMKQRKNKVRGGKNTRVSLSLPVLSCACYNVEYTLRAPNSFPLSF